MSHPQTTAGGSGARLPDHPVRVALLDLLATAGTVTATEAARSLGYSSGLCSFHLRQLARHGLIEEAPARRGRVRPWRLRWAAAQPPEQPAGVDEVLARSLEDESYQRWLSQRAHAPRHWQVDQAYSAVVHLTPAELTELAAAIRATLAGFRDRSPRHRPGDAAPVAAVVRLFPLLQEEIPTPAPAPDTA